ncbi:MAG: EamA family transporter [Limisphaerales bacterium]
MNSESPIAAPRSLVTAAFLTVYLVWGSTYLAIKLGVGTIPPGLLAGTRFFVAGALMYSFLRLRGAPRPAARDWKHAGIIGTALLAGGNGGVTWAEQYVPSSVAALMIATAPAWFALGEWARPGGKRPTLLTAAGIAVGFAGVALLLRPGGLVGPGSLPGIVALVFACAAWATGSIYSRHVPQPASPALGVAMQMIAGGTVMFGFAAATGEPGRFAWAQVSGESLAALAYLIVFGSWLGFTAYMWLLRASTPAKVSTYAFVNPVVAVLLGALLGGEAITGRTLLATGVILAGVLVIMSPALGLAPALARLAGGRRRGTDAAAGGAAAGR